MNKRKLIALVTSVSLLAAVGIGSTLAYFTDSEDIANTVTMGNVNIDLVETTADGEERYVAENGLTFSDVLPGDTLDKDPTIQLKAGSADAYVRVKIDLVLPEEQLPGDEPIQELALPPVVPGITQSDFDVLFESVVTNITGSVNWYYNSTDKYFYYKTPLSLQGNTSANLFTYVNIPTAWTNNTADQTFNMEITAEAVQSDNFTPTTDVNGNVIGWFLEDGTTPLSIENYPGLND